MIQQAKILITGGVGFIGSNMCEYFLKQGWEVYAFDNFSREGVKDNFDIIKPMGVKIIKGDIRKKEDFELLPHVCAIINLAANPGIPWSIKDPIYDAETNIMGALNVFEFARKCGACVIQASTNKVYSDKINNIPLRLNNIGTRYEYPLEYAFGINEKSFVDGLGHPHSPYGCCYDRETEVLTKDGWKLFKDILDNEIVATVNQKTQNLEYQKIIKKHMYDFNGKMFFQKNRRLDILVTPNHNLFVGWNRNSKKLKDQKLVKAKDAVGKTYCYLAGADYAGGEDKKFFELPKINQTNKNVNKNILKKDKIICKIKIDAWLRFLGWYISEGNSYKTKMGNYNVVLSTFYRHEEAVSVFKGLGYKNVIVSDHHIFVSHKRLYEYTKQFGKAEDKFIPKEIKSLPSKRLQVLLKCLLDGDGNKNSKNTYRYTTISKRLADDVSEIAIKCGFSANIGFDENRFYRVYISSSRTIQCNLVENRSGWEDYNGKVYCVSVPNETVMVRRRGKSCFCGNSKLAADIYAQEYNTTFNVPTVVCRMSAIYGPRQMGVSEQGWVTWFMKAKRDNLPITIFGDGFQVRDLLYIDDLCKLYYILITNMNKYRGQVFNVGGGHKNKLSLLEMIDWLNLKPGKKITPKFSDWRAADHKIYISDIRKVEKITGWKPEINVEEGLKRTWEWINRC